MAGAAGAFARLVGQGLSFAIGRRPRSRLELAGFGAAALAWALATGAAALHETLLTPPPRFWMDFAPWVHAGFGAALMLASWLVARVLQRPAAWSTLASLAAIAAIPWTAFDMQLDHWLGDDAPMRTQAISWGLAAVIVAFVLRLVWVLGVGASRIRRLLAGALFVALLTAPWQVRAQTDFWFSFTDEEETAGDEYEAVPEGREPEVLLGRQPSLVVERVAALAPQNPGRVDLYAIGFAGDGSESVFRNEVEFLGRLLPQRFGATGRVLPLINHPDTTGGTPLASLTNLRAALAGVGATMDRDEDVLLLFLTSHGSSDHVLLVGLEELPLRQIEPDDLRRALDDAGIRWRVVVVSACYSGGFIDTLRTPETMVITAASADRTSFGCGSGSEITWFGKAFLTEALNQTTDFREAYAIADRRVREWEKRDDVTPSQPQLWAGTRIDAQLARWRAGVTPGLPVAFVPAVPAPDDEGHKHDSTTPR